MSTTAIISGKIEGFYFASDYALGSTTGGIQEAINAAPAAGSTVVLPQGVTPITTGITINKPLMLVGYGTVATLDNVYGSVLSTSEIKNNTTGSTAITIQLPVGTFLSGITLRDFSVQGNRNFGGATTGDCIRILGGNAATVLRDVLIDNVVCREGFTSGFRVSNNSFLIEFRGCKAFRCLGDGFLVDATTGTPSQIQLNHCDSDLHAGAALHVSSAGGGSGGDIIVTGGTFADSLNGILLDNGSSATLKIFHAHLEANTNDGIKIFGSSAHSVVGCVFYANGANDLDFSSAGQGFGSSFAYVSNCVFLGATPTNIRIASSCNNTFIDHVSPVSPVIVDSGFQTNFILGNSFQYFLGQFVVLGTPYGAGGTAFVGVKDTTTGQATPNKFFGSRQGQFQIFNSAFGAPILTLDDAGNMVLFGTPAPSAAGLVDLGTTALPFSGIRIGNAATNNIRVSGVASAARTVTLMDQTGTVALVAGNTSQRSESAADTNVLTFTPLAVAGTYRLRFVMSVSAANAATLGWTATWTDSNGNAQAPTNLALSQSGAAAPALTFTTSAAGDYYAEATIDTNNAAANIVVKLTFSGTSFTAKVSAVAERLI